MPRCDPRPSGPIARGAHDPDTIRVDGRPAPGPPVVVIAASVVAAEQAAAQLRLDPRSWIAITTATHLGRLRTLRRGTAHVVVTPQHPPRWWADALALVRDRGLTPHDPTPKDTR